MDASFSSSLDRVGIDICISYEKDCLVLAQTLWFSPFCSVEVGEAMGLYSALVWLADFYICIMWISIMQL